MRAFQLLRIFPGDVDTDGDGVIDEREIRIEYLNRELFVETVMNDGDRVSDAFYLAHDLQFIVARSTSDQQKVTNQYCLFNSQVRDDGRLVCTLDTSQDLGVEVGQGGVIKFVQSGGQADTNLVVRPLLLMMHRSRRFLASCEPCCANSCFVRLET